MSKGLSDQQWKSIFELGPAAAKLPEEERQSFLHSRTSDPQVIEQALELAAEIDAGEEDSTSRTGTTIGRFLLEEYLGAGSAGEVYAAHDPALDRKIAIKILLPQMIGVKGADERFIREARAASALNHPNIVVIHEVLQTDDGLAIVMELVRGVPLRKICGAPVELSRLVAICRQVASVLAAAHAAGVVHRDIKPENVMIQEDGRIKVLDFGLARRRAIGDPFTQQEGIPGGTLRYMSPEHCKEQPITARSDVFAFGIVFYELATGVHPFPDGSPLEVLQAIATAEVVDPSTIRPDLPAELASLILSMLTKDPAKRPEASRILERLEAFQVPQHVAPPSGRKKWIWSAVAVCLGLLSLAYVISGRGGTSVTPPKMKQLTRLVSENYAMAAAISGDGTTLAYANVDGVFLQTIHSGEVATIKTPGGFVFDNLAWLPGGTKLVASGISEESNQQSVWALSLFGAQPRELRSNARHAMPSPNGSTIAYISSDGASIWLMDSEGLNPRMLRSLPSEDDFEVIFWAPNGRYLIAQRAHPLRDANSDRGKQGNIESINAQTGQVADSLSNIPFSSAAAVLDGRIMLISGARLDRASPSTLWSIPMDFNTGKFLSAPQIVAAPLATGNYSSLNMTATRDGNGLASIWRRISESIFVADFDRTSLRFSNSRRLTLAESASFPHSWTADGKSIVFESDRSGKSYDLFRQSVSSRVAESLVSTESLSEFLPQRSPDGKYILYAASRSAAKPYSLMRVAISGGGSEEIVAAGRFDEFKCSNHSKGRCVVRSVVGQSEYVFSELDPVRGVGKELARTSWLPSLLTDWDISPDGKVVAIPNHDARSAKIRLLRLDGNSAEPRERDVEVPGLSRIAVVSWTADGSGCFVSIETPVGRRMYFYDFRGHPVFMGSIHGWAVPSPDGKNVAFLDHVVESNVWLLTP